MRPHSNDRPNKQRLARVVHARRHWQGLLAVLIVLVCYLAFAPQPPRQLSMGWDKLNHSAAFVALTFSACLAFKGWQRNMLLDVALAMLAMLALGGAIELVQAFVPGRDSEWADLLADAVGIGLGALVALPLLRAALPPQR